MEITGNYIREYYTPAEYRAAREGDYQEPWVSYTHGDERVDYNKSEYEKLQTPLTFIVQSDGDIVWKASNTAYTVTLECKKNGGEWTAITSTTGGTTIPVVSGDTVQFRGNNTTMSSGSSRYNCFSGTTCQFAVKGNIMSLLDAADFSTLSTLESAYTFYDLFYNCTGLTDASELLLPAITLTTDCYNCMFEGCKSLTTAPSILPATTLTTRCYCYMFFQCTSLTTAPALPATTLANQCYNGMFSDCTSLTIAPELPATRLVEMCYDGMFGGCSNLNYIKCLATDISAYLCTASWVDNVASTGTFVTPSATAWTTGNNGIPANWTRVDA